MSDLQNYPDFSEITGKERQWGYLKLRILWPGEEYLINFNIVHSFFSSFPKDYFIMPEWLPQSKRETSQLFQGLIFFYNRCPVCILYIACSWFVYKVKAWVCVRKVFLWKCISVEKCFHPKQRQIIIVIFTQKFQATEKFKLLFLCCS